jgi:hypothetical protein
LLLIGVDLLLVVCDRLLIRGILRLVSSDALSVGLSGFVVGLNVLSDADSYTLRIYGFWFYSNASGRLQGAGYQLGSEVVLPSIRNDRFGLCLTQKRVSSEWSFLSETSREDEYDWRGD